MHTFSSWYKKQKKWSSFTKDKLRTYFDRYLMGDAYE